MNLSLMLVQQKQSKSCETLPYKLETVMYQFSLKLYERQVLRLKRNLTSNPHMNILLL